MTVQIHRTGLLPFNPAKHARFKDAIAYGFTYPTPNFPIDKTSGLTAWGMDGNGPDPMLTVNGGQPVGDCGVAAVPAHANMLISALGSLNLPAMTSDETVDLYFQYTGGQDTGVDLGDWLLWLTQQGFIKGFVKVDTTSLAAALQIFSVVVVGVALTDDAEQLFGAGQPWTTANGETPDPNEGHAILYVAEDGSTSKYITWGAVQSATDSWTQACVQQAFAVLTEDSAQLLDFTTLLSDLTALGGTVSAIEAPPATSTRLASIEAELHKEVEDVFEIAKRALAASGEDEAVRAIKLLSPRLIRAVAGIIERL